MTLTLATTFVPSPPRDIMDQPIDVNASISILRLKLTKFRQARRRARQRLDFYERGVTLVKREMDGLNRLA